MMPRATNSTVEFGAPTDPRLKQHRCHPRTADLAHTVLSLDLCAAPARARLLYRCLASDPGAEPTEPFLLNPAEQALRQKVWRPRADAAGKQGGDAPAK